jgi:hypothetical protein
MRNPQEEPSGWLGWTESPQMVGRLTLALISVGVILQVANWMFNRSLWNDELAIALNLQERAFGQLAGPLDYGQAAPIGFLWIEKSATAALGQRERTLRLFPLMCGLASLWLANAYFKQWLNAGERLLALGLLVIQPRLVQYSAEIKPYACDVAAALLVLVIELRLWKSRFHLGWLGALAAAGIVLPWISFPVVFVLAATGLSALWGLMTMTPLRWRPLLLAAGAIAGGAVSAAAQYNLLKSASGNSYLAAFWADFFMPRSGPRAAAAWVLWSWIKLFRDPLKGTSEWFTAPLAVVGLTMLVVRHRRPALVLCGLLFIAVAAAAMRLYPFGDRLALYLLPMLVVCVAAAVAGLAKMRPKACGPAAMAILIFVMADPLSRSTGNLLRPKDREDSRRVLGALAGQAQPRDALYVFCHSQLSYKYYAPRLGLGLTPTFGTTVEAADDPQLSRLLAQGRVWIYFAHGSNPPGADAQEAFIRYADSRARPVCTIRAEGSGAFLYEPVRAMPAPTRKGGHSRLQLPRP